MNILIPAALETLTASSEYPYNPATNLMVAHPDITWIALGSSVASATLELECTGPVDGLALFGVVADAVTLQYWDGSAWANVPGIVSEEYDGQGISYSIYDNPYYTSFTNWWMTFTELPGTVNLKLTLTQLNSLTIRAANLFVGSRIAVAGVQYPLEESLIDTSVRTPLLSGQEYYNKRKTYRVFSGSVRDARATAIRSLIYNMARQYGSGPVPIHIAPPWGDDFLVYGRFQSLQASHAWPTYSQAGFEIVEVMGV